MIDSSYRRRNSRTIGSRGWTGGCVGVSVVRIDDSGSENEQLTRPPVVSLASVSPPELKRLIGASLPHGIKQ